ncbi:MAG: DUF4878 domain-containing protein [Chitinophagaceae bacterium]
MYKSLSYFFLALFTFSFSNCKTESDPVDVATSYLNAVEKLDYEGAKKYGTPETIELLSTFATMSGELPDSIKTQIKAAKITIKNSTIRENTCEVQYELSNNPGKEDVLKLIKKDDKWLVHIAYDDMGPEATIPEFNETTADETPQEEAVPLSNSDSVHIQE